MSSFDAVLAQYEKNKQSASSNSKKISQEDRQKKYFNTIMGKGNTTEERRIRILQTKDGSSPFVEVDFHEMLVDGKWVKYYDPAQEGKRSPLNEVREGLLLTGEAADKELAKSYRSKKFYIVKVIDRDHEQDGPKFWRFKHAFKNDGIFDKIFPVFKNKKDLLDSEKGRDLILTLSLTKSNNGKEYTAVSSVIPDDPSPLHTDPAVVKAWTEDELVWSDVYSKRDADYLDIIANGGIPKWDNVTNKYVSNLQASETIGAGTKLSTPVEDPQDGEDGADDLPF